MMRLRRAVSVLRTDGFRALRGRVPLSARAVEGNPHPPEAGGTRPPQAESARRTRNPPVRSTSPPRHRRKTCFGRLPVVVVVLTLTAAPSTAQDLPLPREMNLAAATFQMPDSNQFRILFDNDLMAWAVPDFSAPVVRFTAFVRAGYGDDQRGGVAEALAWIMRTRGPCWLGRKTLAEAMDEIAATLTVTLSAEMTEVTMTAPSGDAERALQLFSGVVRQACVDGDAVRTFAAMHAGGSGEAGYDGSLDEAVRMFYDVVFRDHRYRPGVRPEEAARLEIDDVDDYYRENFTPANTTLAVSGAFRPEELYRLLDFRFSDWEQRRLPGFGRSGTPGAPDTVETHVFDVDKLQTWIVIGQALEPLEPRELVHFEVMNYILGGGHFDTRLFRETRDKYGLTNDASGFIDQGFRGPGTYTIRTYGRPSVSDSLVGIVMREIRHIQEEDVTEEELFVAKGALADGVFPMQFENGHVRARTFAMEWAKYLSLDHLAQYQDRVRGVGAGDVRRAARRIRADRLVVSVIRSR